MPLKRSHYGNSLASDFYDVTPNDDVDLPKGTCNGLWIGTGGNIAFLNGDGDSVIFNVPNYTILPFHISRVLATDTDATNIIALY